MSDIVNCPACRRQLRVPAELWGQGVQCPGCGQTFNAGEPQVPLEQAVTEPPGRISVGSFPPEAEDAVEEGPPPERPRRRWEEDDDLAREWPLEPLAGLSRDYRIEVNDWFYHARQNYAAVLGPMIGYMLIGIGIDLALGMVPFVGQLARLVVDPPFQAGFTVVALYQLKGWPWSFNDFFRGFNLFGPVVLNALLRIGVALVILLPTIILGVLGVLLVERNRDYTFVWIAGGVGLASLPVLIFIWIRAFSFNVLLIVDRGCGPVEAIRGNWILSRGHFWGLLGAILLTELAGISGILLCGIGILFTMPFAYLAETAGYMLIAGTRLPGPPPEPPRPEIPPDTDYPEEDYRENL